MATDAGADPKASGTVHGPSDRPTQYSATDGASVAGALGRLRAAVGSVFATLRICACSLKVALLRIVHDPIAFGGDRGFDGRCSMLKFGFIRGVPDLDEESPLVRAGPDRGTRRRSSSWRPRDWLWQSRCERHHSR